MFLATLVLLATLAQGAQYVNSQSIGATLPSVCNVGQIFLVTGATPAFKWCSAANTWSDVSGTVPQGSILLVASGSCPTGFTESTALNGKMLRGTLAANGDVGTTGGSDSITPTVASLSAAAQTFTGSSANTSAVSAGTPAGTNGTVAITPLLNAIAWPAGVPTAANESSHTHTLTPLGTNTASATTGNCAATNLAIGTGAATACKAAAPNLTVSAQTFTGSSTTTAAGSAHTHVLSWPAGVPTVTGASTTVGAETFTGSALGTHQHTLTATGTNGSSTVTGTLNSFDNRPNYLNVIFCQKS